MPPKKAAPKFRRTRAKSGSIRQSASSRDGNPHLRPGVSFPVVAIGASAGGLAAFTELLKALPSNSGMAFVLIQHLEPKHESALTALLSKATGMPVVEVSDGMAVKPDRVYVIPPNKGMTIREATLRLAPRPAGSGVPRPIDDFSVALANDQGEAAIGVVLSGTGSDGTYGLKTIKAAGGVTFAQDPKTAQWPAMPLSAITAGSVDFVLSPRRIAAELARIGRHPYLAEAQEVPDGSDLDKICLILRSAVGVDFRLYKQATVRRRVARRMALRKIASLKKYAQILKRNLEEAQALANDIFIHVTSFFRDPECFQALRKQVLAKMRARRSAEGPIRIWVAGCSTGEEVYGIAMLLLEELGERADRIKIQIFGTDIQERAVEHARAGIYTEAAVAGVSRGRLKRFFVEADHGYQVQKFVRDLCVFARHDLAKDPPFSRLDLISCRNVLIYMGPALQKRVLSVFQYALKPGGFLFLGNSESIGEYSDAFTVEDQKHRIFSRKPAAPAFREFAAIMGNVRGPEAARSGAPAPSAAVDFRKEAEVALLENYAPPALLVDPDLHIAHFQGDVSRYLVPATGQPSFHLLKMVRPELIVDLRTAIYKARKEGVPVHKDDVRFNYEGQPAAVRLEVRPLTRRSDKKRDLLIVFQRLQPPAPPVSLEEARKPGRAAVKKQVLENPQRLERELASTRENLRALIAEHEAAQQETKAANEEVLSSNEELQSTNEELETAQEELQSANEELVTLNDELQHRNDELTLLTYDLNNLLVGVDIPVLVLDSDLRVRRFTPVAGALLNLIPGDVGRPFSDIASNLDVGNWKQLFSEVTGQGRFIEREVSSTDGRRYSMRVRPYTTGDNKIEGVLMVLLDTELISRARDVAQKSGDAARAELKTSESTIHALLESAPQSVVAVSADQKIVVVNSTTEKMFGYNAKELVGQRLTILLPEHLRERHAGHHRAYFANMQSRPMGIGLDLEGRRRDGTTFPVEIALSALETTTGKLAVAFVSDITQRKRMEDLLRQRERELDTLLNNAPDVIVRFDRDFRYTYANARAEKETGLQPGTMLGKTPGELGIPKPVVDILTRALRNVFETGRPMVAELPYPSPGGETFWEARFIPEFGEDGTVRSVLNVGRDFTEKKRLEQVAQARTQEVQALAASLLTAQEDERRRVSRELHDQICQQLASLAIDIGGLTTDFPPPKGAEGRVANLRARLVKASEEARHLAYELHPSMLDDLGVVASLRALCQEFSERAPGVAVEFSEVVMPASLPREVASCVYRIAQQALENVAEHARAKHVSVALALQKGNVLLTIADDGAGFDPAAVKSRGGLGLIGMEERARLVNGKLTITARPGHGARIAVKIPLSAHTDEASSNSVGRRSHVDA